MFEAAGKVVCVQINLVGGCRYYGSLCRYALGYETPP